jgi:fructose-specific phosphotransferase system IIC component
MAEQPSRTVLTDIDIPFGSLVLFFVKASLAVIPAAIVVSFVLAFVSWIFGALLGFGHMGWMMR